MLKLFHKLLLKKNVPTIYNEGADYKNPNYREYDHWVLNEKDNGIYIYLVEILPYKEGLDYHK